jgi:hypothetical protein
MKGLYILHPTTWTRFFLGLARPFVSSKSWKKVHSFRTINDLFSSGLITRDQITIPRFVYEEDSARVIASTKDGQSNGQPAEVHDA